MVFFAENEGFEFVSNHGSQSRNLGKYGIFADLVNKGMEGSENENLIFRFPANTGGGRNLSSIKSLCGAVVFLGGWWVFLVDAVFFWGGGWRNENINKKKVDGALDQKHGKRSCSTPWISPK